MRRESLLAPLIAASLLFCALPAAHAQLRIGELCEEGPIIELAADADWGPESTCRCDGFRGGATIGDNGYAWLWSQGYGIVVLLAEVESPDRGRFWVTPQRATGRPGGSVTKWFIVEGGAGLTEEMFIPGGSRWTSRFRANCHRNVPYESVRARCSCEGGQEKTTSVCVPRSDAEQSAQAVCQQFCIHNRSRFADLRIFNYEGVCRRNKFNTDFLTDGDPI